jgi:hypothetical protein
MRECNATEKEASKQREKRMRPYRRTVFSFISLLLLASALPAAEVKLQPMNYKDLGQLVRGQKGKVVVVDFWRHD